MTAAWRRAERLAVAVMGRAGGADDARRVAERALALVAMVECARPMEARPTAAGLVELLEIARSTPATWEEVRAEWRAYCDAAAKARESAHWVQALGSLEALGERELARLWGVELPGATFP